MKGFKSFVKEFRFKFGGKEGFEVNIYILRIFFYVQYGDWIWGIEGRRVDSKEVWVINQINRRGFEILWGWEEIIQIVDNQKVEQRGFEGWLFQWILIIL